MGKTHSLKLQCKYYADIYLIFRTMIATEDDLNDFPEEDELDLSIFQEDDDFGAMTDQELDEELGLIPEDE